MRLVVYLLLAACAAAPATAAVVEAGKPMPRYALLKEGTHRYLRFTRDGESNTPVDIWARTVRFDPQSGRLHITQRWDGASTRRLDSWFEAGTFLPVSHQRIIDKDGKRTVEGFLFRPGQVTGMPDLADNTQKSLVVPLLEPAFNFETDIEMLQTLPLADGYEAVINFYHPGGPAPARYTFRVAGSEVLAGPAGPVECWRVTTDYNRPGTVSTFWFAKATQQFVRQESPTPSGKTLVKTLID
jgi:hypothetical protein